MAKTALITGVRGQDGAYLSKLLLEKGYHVIGTDRRKVEQNDWRLDYVGVGKDMEIIYMDLLELSNIYRVIKKIQPDEVYNLAAQSSVGFSFSQPLLTAQVNALGVLRLLDAIYTINPKIKFYQASSSELFGQVLESPQNENTPFNPISPYSISKQYAHYITKNFRDSTYNLFACTGILFNHESPLRGNGFVTKKITRSAAKIKLGLQDRLTLGNLNASRDWGFAGDYVDGMWRMLQQFNPDDFVLATGETNTVRHFVEIAFNMAGFDIAWEGEGVNEKGIDKSNGKVLIEVSPEFFRPAEVDSVVGDASKAKEMLDWEPKVSFKELVNMMYQYDFDEIKRNS